MADWHLRGEVLASAREAASMSREQLAVAVRVADEYRVELWEQGVERPQARVIPLLAANLAIDALSLLDGDPRDPDLTHLRVAAGLSLTEMAKRVGLPITSYHRLERRGASRRGLAEATARAIAAALEIPIERVDQLAAPRLP